MVKGYPLTESSKKYGGRREKGSRFHTAGYFLNWRGMKKEGKGGVGNLKLQKRSSLFYLRCLERKLNGLESCRGFFFGHVR